MAPDRSLPFFPEFLLCQNMRILQKESEFFAGFFVLLVQIISASHRKTAESRRNGGQNHEDDCKDNHSIHKVCHGLYNADRESQIHTETVKQLHQHSGAGGSNSTEKQPR